MANKKPSRRAELLSLAQTLFLEKGYEQTSMQDICSAAGVSKGALYHHFKSKEEVLDAMVDALMERAVDKVSIIARDPILSAAEKMEQIIGLSIDSKMDTGSESQSFKHAIQHPHNALLFFKLRNIWVSKIGPEIEIVITQGVTESVFDVQFPEETARTLVMTISDFGDEMERIIANKQTLNVAKALERSKQALFCICHRLLGAAQN
ncbi:Nucleoid occlusion factor SlmA [Vibrio stylophorae]|uniref:Nucleoid occlusion factor SlmA n=1 Tax=Vibrio stylophorae TaxID=659351 RepID=A0ABN8DZ08_9VIBR|nr:TetR/AcrR family transcriptional regulator [Vibrio stylophorae]CAH0535513.1 Nucleoid occlusion factor SlmA [Vibrio stylophorae]